MSGNVSPRRENTSKKKAPGKKSFKELAKLANVSPATVSRVAKGQVNVDAAIRTRVRKAAEALGIDLDHKRNEKANIIAFMLSNRDLLHNFQARILFGSESYCASQDRELLFMSFRYAANTPSKELHLPENSQSARHRSRDDPRRNQFVEHVKCAA